MSTVFIFATFCALFGAFKSGYALGWRDRGQADRVDFDLSRTLRDAMIEKIRAKKERIP